MNKRGIKRNLFQSSYILTALIFKFKFFNIENLEFKIAQTCSFSIFKADQLLL